MRMVVVGNFLQEYLVRFNWIPLKSPQATFQFKVQNLQIKTVDILVVYTPNAEAHEGGKEEIEATITAEIEKTNQALNQQWL